MSDATRFWIFCRLYEVSQHLRRLEFALDTAQHRIMNLAHDIEMGSSKYNPAPKSPNME